MKARNQNEKGSTMILSLVAALALSLIAALVSSSFLDMRKQQNRQTLLATVNQIHQNITNAVYSDAVWAETLALNPAPTALVPFTLYDPSGAKLYDATSASEGFTIGGLHCMTWTAAGSTDCPLNLDLKWQPVAQCGSVITPSYSITASYDYQYSLTAFNFPINWGKYAASLNLCRSIATQSFRCSGVPAGTCAAPDQWYCSATGWKCGSVYKP